MKKYTMPSLQDILMIHEEEMFDYVLQANRQKMEEMLLRNAIYPMLPYTASTLHECNQFVKKIDTMYESFPQEIIKVIFNEHEQRLDYRKMKMDEVVENIYEKTLVFRDNISRANVEFIKKTQECKAKITIESIGIVPSTHSCGVLFAQYEYKPQVHTFHYNIPTIATINPWENVVLKYIESWTPSFVNTYSNKKLEYIKKFPWYDGTPYCISATWKIPLSLKHTVLPIVRLELLNV